MIKVENIWYSHKKRLFGKTKANDYFFEGINLDIEDGNTVALLGLNGVGKSTLIKIILGIISVEKGQVTYDGVNVHKDRVRLMQNIGVVWGQRSTLWWDIPVIESYKTLQQIYKIADEDFSDRLKYFIDSFEMGGFVDKPVRKLSLGQRVKSEIVASLLHNPQILVYDESFIGLDLVTKTKVLDVLSEIIKTDNKTLLITSHDMYDIERLCKSVVIVNKKELKTTSVDTFVADSNSNKEIVVKMEAGTPLVVSEGMKNKVVISEEVKGEYKITFDVDEVKEEELLEELIKNNKFVDIQVKKIEVSRVIENFLRRNNGR